MKQSHRRVLYGTNMALLILIIFAVALIVNYLGIHYHKRYDITANKYFSLSEQTRNVVNSLSKPVHITTFFGKDYADSQRTYDLLEEYKNLSNKIKVEKVDPLTNPSLTKEKGIKRYGVVLFESGNKLEQATILGEQEVTNALIKVSSEEIKTIYFLDGHGENDSKSSTPEGYAEFSQRLRDQANEIKTIKIFQKAPEDCDLLIIAGAKKPLLDTEIIALENYLAGGGRLLLLLNPGVNIGIEDLLSEWGVSVVDDLVVDPKSSYWQDVTTPVIVRYYQHQIIHGLAVTFFPQVRSVTKRAEVNPQLTVQPIMMTTPGSWAETTPDKIQFDEGIDRRGPIDIGIAIIKSLLVKTDETKDEVEERYARLVVLGDADFATNSYFNLLSNGDLILNAVNWLVEDEKLISIRPKQPDQRLVQLTGAQIKTLFYINVFLVPLAIISIGTIVWWRRRS